MDTTQETCSTIPSRLCSLDYSNGGCERVLIWIGDGRIVDAYHEGRQWFVACGNTLVEAQDEAGAERIAFDWGRTGKCPTRDGARITPRTQREAPLPTTQRVEELGPEMRPFTRADRKRAERQRKPITTLYTGPRTRRSA